MELVAGLLYIIQLTTTYLVKDRKCHIYTSCTKLNPKFDSQCMFISHILLKILPNSHQWIIVFMMLYLCMLFGRLIGLTLSKNCIYVSVLTEYDHRISVQLYNLL